MAEVLSPIVSDRIWAVPVSGAAVKFLHYLVFRSEFGGHLPVRQKDMAKEYKITPQAVSLLMAPLCDLNIVLRPSSDGRGGNSYRLHPLAAKYESHDDMEAAFRHTLQAIKAGELPNLKLPSYATAPPSEGRPNLQVA
ncbi:MULTISPECIES: hypothetical protein [Streptomyces]|uniref:hypothetical protein n=1 Tax=Streptomyces TaxID=1883 RepID=UPI0022566CA5|nr:hypothetical protein [Streptomyces atratus]MCX5345844.1 hypothetical protein [Streptomyces atratus]